MVEITTNTHKSVGPFTELYGHGPVIFIRGNADENLWVCLDCGWTDTDERTLSVVECDRSENRVNQNMREFLEENEYP
jgi:hypothetical protein